ncbi:SDR family NAD(P)-dependent oxidoreductase [Planctomyces sp. SH-PL62]|uniref:SDR family NAD(P)-dependent oxidoreductase n=1 Tax=Planctomyces sp. SH-PL62 TaxID=1636152 RepID=UPI00078C8314|nr:SDR family NAD(P)-dependent oxidoreductase [Planctomyces sp. SH-PL62]AMV38843.1 UDP-glucose 4-epimerase [Planctomyces sp. SH-PL62]
MRTIVTGGAGFIGSHLVDRLLDDGHEVVVVDDFDAYYPRAVKEANLAGASGRPGFRLVEMDVRDAAAVDALVREARPDAIAHLAARAGVRPSIAAPALYTEVNVLGTVNWLSAAAGLEPRPRFVYASSSSVYGDRDEGPFRETDPVERPVSPYAASKRACELMAHVFHHLHGLPITGLRFFTAYGPRNRPDLAVSLFADRIERGEPVVMFGDGSTRRDYTYVGDIVDGVVRAIDRCAGLKLYNLGNSHPVELREMIETLAAALGKPAIIRRAPEQPGDVRQTFADVSAAVRELGYAPNTPLREGLDRFVAWRRDRTIGR